MKFLTKATVRLMGATALLALSSLSATAQTYPNKAITLSN